MVGFVALLVVGDPILATAAPRSAPLLVPDNLLAIGTSQRDGLTAVLVDPAAGAAVTVAVVLVSVVGAAWAEGHRDAPAPR